MKTINLNNLTLLGSDYKRNTDYFLDAQSGKGYKRKVGLFRSKKDIECAEQTVYELVEGDAVYDTSGKPVLSRDN